MPFAVAMGSMEFITAANYSLFMYPGLSHGAMELIEEYGTPEQWKLYGEKILQREWGGTSVSQNQKQVQPLVPLK